MVKGTYDFIGINYYNAFYALQLPDSVSINSTYLNDSRTALTGNDLIIIQFPLIIFIQYHCLFIVIFIFIFLDFDSSILALIMAVVDPNNKPIGRQVRTYKHCRMKEIKFILGDFILYIIQIQILKAI